MDCKVGQWCRLKAVMHCKVGQWCRLQAVMDCKLGQWCRLQGVIDSKVGQCRRLQAVMDCKVGQWCRLQGVIDSKVGQCRRLQATVASDCEVPLCCHTPNFRNTNCHINKTLYLVDLALPRQNKGTRAQNPGVRPFLLGLTVSV